MGDAIINTLKGLGLWRMSLLLLLLLASAGAVYGVYLWVGQEDSDILEEDQQIVTVTEGNLVNQVVISGSLLFPTRETLKFGSAGVLEEIRVEEGDYVDAGQVIAALDVETLATLRQDIDDARVKIKDTEEAIEDLNNPYTDLDVVLAEEKIVKARVALRDAEEAIEDLLNPDTTLELVLAEEKIVKARGTLRDAEDALAELRTPPDLEEGLVRAELDVEKAKLDLSKAKDALADLTAGADPDDVADAESNVTKAAFNLTKAEDALARLTAAPDPDDLDRAKAKIASFQTSLENARLDLALLDDDWEAKLETAAAVRDDALAEYQDKILSYLGANVGLEDSILSPMDMLAQWGTSLEALFTSSQSDFTNLAEQLQQNQEDPDTPWSELVVNSWNLFFVGSIVPVCDEDTILSPYETCISRELETPWQKLDEARSSLENLQNQYAAARSKSEEGIGAIEQSIADAQTTLDDLFEDPDPLDVESAQLDVNLARESLEEATSKLGELFEAPDPLDVESAQLDVNLARQSLEEATSKLGELFEAPDPLDVETAQFNIYQARLTLADAERKAADLHEELLEQPDPVDVEAKAKAIESAQATLAQAVKDLADLFDPPDPLEMALLQSRLVTARIALDAAESRLESAVVVAPWSGLVASVNVEKGDEITLNSRVVEIVDPRDVEVDGIIDEIDVLSVQVGDQASVSMDALPGEFLTGVVSSIDAGATNQQGVVTYPVRVRITVPAELNLIEGLSAVAEVVIQEERGLLVPIQAVMGRFDAPIVQVMEEGLVQQRAVTLGISDDFWVIVTSGLTEGEQVVFQAPESSGFDFGGFRGGPGFIMRGGPGR